MIIEVLAVVSSIPAAISCVVAELSSAISLFVCIISFSLSISVRIAVSVSVISLTKLRNTFLISPTAQAIMPVSSFLLVSFSPPSVFLKFRSAVCLMTAVIPEIGLPIFMLMITPSTILSSRHTTTIPARPADRLTAPSVISAHGAVSARYMPLLSS